ncbi:hypothetical protein AMTR_s00077p00066700 [Amborella trichopoda]|uniref:DRBM domain-containing protein n=1 Tax=Amborella trichopoda TaxID=13333 RepID=W1P2P9_AMBTC|nr:hypothetical protein AMTR_s00077p00066700 [Amborella trichopoda]
MDGKMSDASSQVSNAPLHNLEAYVPDMPQYMAALPPPPTPEHHGIPPLEPEIFYNAPNLDFPPISNKHRLHEILMQGGEPLPQYTVRIYRPPCAMVFHVTVTVCGRTFQGEASCTKKDAEKYAVREALVFINLLPTFPDTLSETLRENEGLRERQAELLAALDASRSVSGRAERELLDVRNAIQALSREYELIVDVNVQLGTQLTSHHNEPLPPLDFNLEDLEPI